jgi:hypothetical protein
MIKPNIYCSFNTDWFFRIGEAIDRHLRKRKQTADVSISADNTHQAEGCLATAF